MREADVAIRMKEPSQADLIRKRLMSVKLRLFATPEYLDSAGRPDLLTDLAKHRLISQNPKAPQVGAGQALLQFLLSHNIPRHLTVNNYFGVLQSVIHNLGIGVLPDYVVEDFPQLERVLPDVESNEVPVYLAYPEELRHSKRIQTFRDFVQDEVISHRRSVRDKGNA